MKRISSLGAAACLTVLILFPATLTAQDAVNQQGLEVYTKWCGHCHGDQGDGQGSAALRLKPQPRDFTSGKYKIRMTTTGNIPTDDDLVLAIRKGLYGTSMPAFPETYLSDAEVDAVVDYIKSFSDWFSDPDLQNPEVITIPDPPPYDLEAAQTTGRQVYEETGCARCHGDKGRGDGSSAPTLVDDWGNNIKVADLSQPWTFRGGGSRRDIFRTMSTGFNGTPMPGFHNSLAATPEESQQRMWAIVDYMLSLSGGPRDADASPYDNVLRSVSFAEEIELENAELFAAAPSATFPIFGQIIEPGRNFYPSVVSVTAQAVHNEKEIAFRLTWNDMRAENTGTNGPDLAAPTWDEQLAETGTAASASEGDDEGDFWGEEASGDEAGGDDSGDFWGDEVAEEPADDGGDFWGEEEATDDSGDFWGEDDGGGAAPAATGPDTEFSDAIALQFPLKNPEGVRKPYFLFGDVQNPVDLWFVDLAQPKSVQRYEGRGSSAITPAEGGEEVSTTTTYEDGQWTVIFKRKRKSSSLSFEEAQFLPVAFSVWDGFNRERGNKRGLSSWYQVYVEPLAKPSPVGPMTRAGVTVFGLELLFIALVRRRKNGQQAG